MSVYNQNTSKFVFQYLTEIFCLNFCLFSENGTGSGLGCHSGWRVAGAQVSPCGFVRVYKRGVTVHEGGKGYLEPT